MIAAETSSPRAKPFYQLGGNLPADAPSYVRRAADVDLLTHLNAGRFCYVLTSRQMGKSSLMVQTAKKLREAGTQVAVLDLTRIGQNLTPEQWYDGLLIPLGREFRLADELDDFWNSNDPAISKLGPMQRWLTALHEVILRSVKSRIVIFVDEIDAVRGLRFSTDEFFAGIRQLYNERTIDPELERITFCLLGVAKPSDLIRNVNTTPFNVGHRIVLTDFTEEEALPLLAGLGREEELAHKLLHRTLWWTGGHPYLTQRMCAKIAQDPSISSDSDVDRLCEDTFLSSRARENDDNLLFVRERLLRSEVDRASLLDLYGQIRSGKRVADDDSNSLIDTLRLAGLVAVSRNHLVVRNRIYADVFDKNWIRQNMPDAELRRQKRAFRKGLTIAAGIAVIVFGVVTFLTLQLNRQSQETENNKYSDGVVAAQRDFDKGDFGAGAALLKTMTSDQVGWRASFDSLCRKSGASHRLLNPAELTCRFICPGCFRLGFDWKWLRGLSNGESATTYRGHWDDVRSVDISRCDSSTHGSPCQSNLVVTGGADSTVRVFDITKPCTESRPKPVGGTGTGIPVDPEAPNSVPCFQLKYALFVGLPKPAPLNPGTIDQDVLNLVKSWDKNSPLTDSKPQHPQPGSLPSVMSVRFSPDGAWVAVAVSYWRSTQVPGKVYLWRLSDGQTIDLSAKGATLHRGAINALAFDKDWQLATAGNDGQARFFKIGPDGSFQQRPVEHYPGNGGVDAAAFSPSGRYYAMAYEDGHLRIKDMRAADANSVRESLVDVSGVVSLAFFGDDMVLVGSKDGHIWQVDCSATTLKPRAMLESGQGLVQSLAVLKDPVPKSARETGILVAGGSDSTVKVWRLQRDYDEIEAWEPRTLRGHGQKLFEVAIANDKSLVVSGSADQTVRFWDRQPIEPGDSTNPEDSHDYASHPLILPVDGVVRALAFSPTNGQQLVYMRGVPDHEENGPADCPRRTQVFFYDLASRTPRGPITAHCGFGTAVAYSPDGFQVATGADDGTLFLWDTKQIWKQDGYRPAQLYSPDRTLKPQVAPHIYGLAYSSDGSLAASDGTSILLWKHPNPAAAPESKPDHLRAALNPDSKTLTVPLALAFSPDGRFLAACTVIAQSLPDGTRILKNSLDLFDIHNDEKIVSLTGEEAGTDGPGDGALQGPCVAVAFSPDDNWLAAGTSSREIVVWSVPSIKGHWKSRYYWKRLSGDDRPHRSPSNINAVAFSQNSNFLAYAATDSEILLWSPEYKRQRPNLNVHLGGVWSIAFSPNGNCLASGSTDGTLRITPTVPRDNTKSDSDSKPDSDLKQVWVPYGDSWNSCVGPPTEK